MKTRISAALAFLALALPLAGQAAESTLDFTGSAIAFSYSAGFVAVNSNAGAILRQASRHPGIVFKSSSKADRPRMTARMP